MNNINTLTVIPKSKFGRNTRNILYVFIVIIIILFFITFFIMPPKNIKYDLYTKPSLSPNKSAGWVIDDNSVAWDPKIRESVENKGLIYTDIEGRDADCTKRFIDYDVPQGMRTAHIFYLPWNNSGYFDVWGRVGTETEWQFINRVNAYQDVRNTEKIGFHDGASILNIPQVNKYSRIRIQGQKGRIHLMGISWIQNNLSSSQNGGFVHWDNVTGIKNLNVPGGVVLGGEPHNDWPGVNMKRRDGRWTHFDWKDDEKNYIRGNTQMDGDVNIDGELNVPSGKGVNIRDKFHGMIYNQDVDGPFIHGWGGGKLGTTQNDKVTNALSWDANGNVNIDGNFTVKGKSLSASANVSNYDYDVYTKPSQTSNRSGGWNVDDNQNSWDPKIRGKDDRKGLMYTDVEGRDNDCKGRFADYDIPAGTRTAHIFHLPWSNCGYFDVWGRIGNDAEWQFINRINSFQNVRNEQKLNFHDGATIVPIPQVNKYNRIRIQGQKGRIHLMGIGWLKNDVSGSQSSGFVHWDNVTGKENMFSGIPGDINLQSGKGLFIRDANHGVIFTGDMDGPKLFGWGGGKLSTKEQDIIKWGKPGNIVDTGGVNFINNWDGNATNKTSQIANDTKDFKALLIAGNSSGDKQGYSNKNYSEYAKKALGDNRRNVQVWDDLSVPSNDAQVCIGPRWCIRAEGENLVFRDMKSTGDHRYAMFYNQGNAKNL